MKYPFIKMHGLGNNFAIFDGRENGSNFLPEQIRNLGHRQTGIGFDQMIVILLPVNTNSDAFIKIYNADGSEASACGNASRCVAHLLNKNIKKDTLIIETKVTNLICEPRSDLWCVDMGLVNMDWQRIPLSQPCDTLHVPFAMGGLSDPVAVNVGNPHVVFFVPDIDQIDLARLGPQIEHAPLFPERVNVEIAQVINSSTIKMSVWERGAGLTLACGTGACATAIAAIRRGLVPRGVIEVVQTGGSLFIDWRESDNHVLMTGPVAEVYRGEVEL
jgi:diaminopimelate epimerase